ncbi:hypothetical protein WSK_0524 [Novosphingobium sp. Rr 2-17]|uniref:hypothetical protein n=1 Tax=Novosphingobium sp. Rr 2-17 TaxID=555793 RepID=UPI000269A16C|nr:hypothetical protein [Novosphingobium sp. Rr 2-17]EIZ80842.1 hypothetical protein WSK_0524 [Novosphingobium sp. Rr 2-17]
MTIFYSRGVTSLAAIVLAATSAAPAFAQSTSYPGGPEAGRDYSAEHDDRPVYQEPAQSQSSEGSQDEQQSESEGQYDQRSYDQDYQNPPRRRDSFDEAVDICEDELTQGGKRIGSVDDVRRMGGRFSVAGKLDDGRGYACSVDDEGHIRSVAVDGRVML